MSHFLGYLENGIHVKIQCESEFGTQALAYVDSTNLNLVFLYIKMFYIPYKSLGFHFKILTKK